jgi:hypothetical protein
MEISNLLLTENSSDIMAANLDQTLPWHDSPWAKQSMAKLRRLYENSTFAVDDETPFELMILPLRQISVPAFHSPIHSEFQRGLQAASALEKFLLDQARALDSPPPNRTHSEMQAEMPAAAAGTAGAGAVGAAASTPAPAAQRRRSATLREGDKVYWITNPSKSIEWVFQVRGHDDGAAHRVNRIQLPGFFKLFVTARLDEKRAAASSGGQAFVLPTDRSQSVALIVELLQEWLKRFRNAPPVELVLGHFASSTQSNIVQIAKACFKTDIGAKKGLRRGGLKRPHNGDGPSGDSTGEIEYKFHKLQYDAWENARKQALEGGASLDEAAKAGASAAAEAADAAGAAAARPRRSRWRAQSLLRKHDNGADDNDDYEDENDNGSAAGGGLGADALPSEAWQPSDADEDSSDADGSAAGASCNWIVGVAGTGSSRLRRMRLPAPAAPPAPPAPSAKTATVVTSVRTLSLSVVGPVFLLFLLLFLLSRLAAFDYFPSLYCSLT